MTNKLGKKIKSILRIISYGVLSLIGVFVLYVAYMKWEVSEIKYLCKEAKPGTPIAKMKSLISDNGGRWFKSASVKTENDENLLVETICATSTMCEARCLIYHNGNEVVEATHDARKVISQPNKSDSTNYKNEKPHETQTGNFPTISTDKINPATTKPVTTRKHNEAAFIGKKTFIPFWQTSFLTGNQGDCTIEFMFDGNSLAAPIDDLRFKVHLITKQGKMLGSGSFQINEPIGGSIADRYKTAIFNGIRIKNPKEDSEISALCMNDVTLIFDEASGRQDGREVELIHNNHLRYTKSKAIKIQVNSHE